MFETETPVFCSQNGEDILLAKAFEGRENGFYVELGSHDGMHLSNTYHFEQVGWTGLLVEAHSGLVEKLKSNRRGSVCVHAAVCESDGEVSFYETPTGSLSTFDPSQRDYFIKTRSEVTAQSYRKTNVRTARTTTLLDEANAPSTIDFMSIDVEGAELAALKSLDFDKYNVRVFIVEFDRKQKEESRRIEELLAAKGYRVARTIGVNAFWVKEVELAAKIRQLSFAGEVYHFEAIDGGPKGSRVSISFASGEDSRKRSLLTRLQQSFEKRRRKYLKKAA